MNYMVELFCPKCKTKLSKQGSDYKCGTCQFALRDKDGVLVSTSSVDHADTEFYNAIYEGEHGQKWFQGLNRQSLAKRILEKISLSYRRERFFKRNIKGKNNVILDLACGAGRDYFKNYGTVIGVDLSYKPLEQARQRYDTVIQSACDSLPFADNTFDYIVSSDFFGHVRAEDKDKIINEILRILKPGGKTLHIIETDSNNIWFKIAHKDPVLFQKYFVEKIGGHVGLEMPEECVRRWNNIGFEVIKATKIWGFIWPIEYFRDMFDNEYRNNSALVKLVVWESKILSRIKIIKVIINVLLNPVNYIIELSTPLNRGNGLMLVCQKKI